MRPFYTIFTGRKGQPSLERKGTSGKAGSQRETDPGVISKKQNKTTGFFQCRCTEPALGLPKCRKGAPPKDTLTSVSGWIGRGFFEQESPPTHTALGNGAHPEVTQSHLTLFPQNKLAQGLSVEKQRPLCWFQIGHNGLKVKPKAD